MRLRVLVFTLALALAAGVASAQQTGQIFGKVADSTGAVMPGVTVTLSGGSLLKPEVALTSATGTYQFPQLPIGSYTVKFEMSGFKTVLREGIRIEIGFNAQINAALEVSAVQETVTVSGATPVVDLRDTSKTTRFTTEALQSIPSARDPWVIIEQSAGVAMDRQNVGGSASGQQSNFVARAANMAQQKWNLDGVDITDMSATGGSPNYFDFDAFEEMQISAGGADVTMQTPGVSVNLVTKSGTDKLRGSGRFYITNDAFESINITDDMRKQGATTGSPIQDIKDFGIEAGGPIKKGRAWFWGAYGKQNVKAGVNNFYMNTPACSTMKADLAKDPLSHSVEDVWNCLNTDLTELINYNAKVGVQLFKNNQFNFYMNAAGKIRNARGADDLHPIESTNRQMGVSGDAGLGSPWWKTGINKTYKWSDRQIFTDRFMTEFQVAHVGNNFVMDFHDDSLKTVQPSLELYAPNGLYGRSYWANTYVRPTDSLDATGNYFMPGTLGGDHSLKFGFKIRNDVAHSETHYGGNAIDRFAYGLPYQVEIRRDSYSEYQLKNRSFFLQDTFSRKRVTLNGGIRFDYQTDLSRAGTVAAVPFYNQATFAGTMQYCSTPNGTDKSTWKGCTTYNLTGAPLNQLPSVAFNGAKALGDQDFAFKNWSPRVAFTYDVTGDGRNVLKANFAHYVSQAGTGYLSGTYTMTGSNSYVRYPWVDLNGDKFVQSNEIAMIPTPLSSGGNYDWKNPDKIATPTGKVNPDIVMDTSNEFIVGFERQFGRDIGVGASFIYRRYNNLRQNWTTDNTFGLSSWTSANYVQATYTPAASTCPSGARCPAVTYFTPTSPVPSYYVKTNTPDYYREYKGVELTARKRMSNRWLMNASFSYNDAPAIYTSSAAYQDPTNIDMYNGAQYAEESTSSGLDNVFVNAKWIARLSGSYTLPWHEINVAGFLNTRSGFPYMAVVQSPDRGNLAGSTNVLLDPVGDVRLPNFTTIDFRLDKTFKISTARFIASMDVFNLLNGNTTLSERRVQNSTNANTIANLLAPRVLRFGVRMTF